MFRAEGAVKLKSPTPTPNMDKSSGRMKNIPGKQSILAFIQIKQVHPSSPCWFKMFKKWFRRRWRVTQRKLSCVLLLQTVPVLLLLSLSTCLATIHRQSAYQELKQDVSCTSSQITWFPSPVQLWSGNRCHPFTSFSKTWHCCAFWWRKLISELTSSVQLFVIPELQAWMFPSAPGSLLPPTMYARLPFLEGNTPGHVSSTIYFLPLV